MVILIFVTGITEHYSLLFLKALAEELANKPGSLTAVKCDVSKDDDVINLFSTIKKQFGGVDVCINNAGVAHSPSIMGLY